MQDTAPVRDLELPEELGQLGQLGQGFLFAPDLVAGGEMCLIF
jgi:hypothetical protein